MFTCEALERRQAIRALLVEMQAFAKGLHEK
jgi:hypothetical protein